MADTLMINNFNQRSSPCSFCMQSPPQYKCNKNCHRNKFVQCSTDNIDDEDPYNEVIYPSPNPSTKMRRQKINEHWDEFMGTSTLHGFHYCFDKRYIVRRVLWTIIVLGSVGMLLEKLYESGEKYFQYPFSSTTTTIDVDEMEFPAISICNNNEMRLSQMYNTSLHRALEEGKGTDSISGEEYARITKAANHVLDHMIYSCNLLKMKCTAKNFSAFFQAQGQKCYTINSSDLPGSSRAVVTGTGIEHSFDLIINVEHYDYYTGTKDSGMRVIIHDPNETPVQFRGLSLSPGFSTSIEITKKKIVNLKLPYKTACGSRKLKYFKHYSENTCWLEHLTDHVVKHCKCKDGFMPGNAKVCSIQELINCTWPVGEEFNKLKNIDCPVACEVVSFKPLLSFAQFPSNNEADRIAREYKLSGSKQDNRRFIRDNLLRLRIYFEKMSYTKMEQTPSYDIMVLLGDIGGQLGLFLGTSILTYIEFFDVLAMVIYTKYFEIFKRK